MLKDITIKNKYIKDLTKVINNKDLNGFGLLDGFDCITYYYQNKYDRFSAFDIYDQFFSPDGWEVVTVNNFVDNLIMIKDDLKPATFRYIKNSFNNTIKKYLLQSDSIVMFNGRDVTEPNRDYLRDIIDNIKINYIF